MRAFSLVELSIVLVILGLLTGGILAGKSLIRASEVRAVSAEYSRYASARFSFFDKYFGLPGDITNATSFWGAADNATGSSATCYTTVSADSKTCNGNGNGILEPGATSRSAEVYRYWQQLANAGMIEGQYSGTLNGGTYAASARYAAAGINIPASRLSSGAWYTETAGYHDGSSWAWEGEYQNPFFFGGVETTDITEIDILLPEEAWNIDRKLDDGLPALGRVRAYKIDTDCNSTVSAATAEYLLTSTTRTCHLVFIPGK